MPKNPFRAINEHRAAATALGYDVTETKYHRNGEGSASYEISGFGVLMVMNYEASDTGYFSLTEAWDHTSRHVEKRTAWKGSKFATGVHDILMGVALDWREREAADPYCAKHGRRFDNKVGCPDCLAELEDEDHPTPKLDALMRDVPDFNIELPMKYTIEFHNPGNKPTLIHREVKDDEDGLLWYLENMVTWDSILPGESVVIRREVV